MCVAIYSPANNNVPSIAYLKTAWTSNPDGAGFAYNTNDGRVRILKGFMTWDAFWKTFKDYSNKYNFYKRGVLIHFRIATHGGVNPECTHPFPLVSDEGYMKKTESIADYAVIHNGRISLTSSETYSKDKMSDTMIFIQKYLAKLASNARWFNNPTNMELIYDLIDSKMAILNGRGEIKCTSGFTKDEDGNYYSNDTYKVPRVKTTTYYNSASNYSGKYYGRYNDYYENNTYYYGETKRYWYELMEVVKDDEVTLENGAQNVCTGKEKVYRDEDGYFYYLKNPNNYTASTEYICGELVMLFSGAKGKVYHGGEEQKFACTHKSYYTYVDRARKEFNIDSKISPTTYTSNLPAKTYSNYEYDLE